MAFASKGVHSLFANSEWEGKARARRYCQVFRDRRASRLEEFEQVRTKRARQSSNSRGQRLVERVTLLTT
jgi:hypothetical protein